MKRMAFLLMLAALTMAAQAPARKGPQPGRPPSIDQYGPNNWVDPDRAEPAGTHYHTFHSRTINADVSYLIYLPPDYETQPSTHYPVVYFLHGSGGTPRAGAGLAKRLDDAIRAHRTRPVITVYANGLAGNTMYCDTPDGKFPVETVIVHDLVPHIDATYRTIASRESRAVEGFSMGGFGAAMLGFKYPEVFGVVSIEAPALLGPHVEGHDPSNAWARLFPVAMGGDMEYFHAHDPFTLAVKNAAALRDRSMIRIATHQTPGNWQSGRCEELHRLLVEQSISHQFFFLLNVKSHNRALVLDAMGDSAFALFGTTLR